MKAALVFPAHSWIGGCVYLWQSAQSSSFTEMVRNAPEEVCVIHFHPGALFLGLAMFSGQPIEQGTRIQLN